MKQKNIKFKFTNKLPIIKGNWKKIKLISAVVNKKFFFKYHRILK